MRPVDHRRRHGPLIAGARIFALLLLAPPIAVAGDFDTVFNVILLATLWMAATLVEGLGRLPVTAPLLIEAALVTSLVSLGLLDSVLLLPALVVPAFIGGVVRGVRGAFEVLAVETAVLFAFVVGHGSIRPTPELLGSCFTWLMAALGVGLVAVIAHRSRDEVTTDSSYRHARRLITRLLELSDDLVEGLDPVSIADNILLTIGNRVPLQALVVYIPEGDEFTVVAEGGADRRPTQHRRALLNASMLSQSPAKAEHEVAIPLLTEAGLVGVVVGHLPRQGDNPALEEQLSALVEALRPQAVQLDTALLFSRVRDAATRDERLRLAREMHDGVSQDLASLGYLIDDLAADDDLPTHAVAGLSGLRTELTKIVAELRRSVFSLRNELAGSLGSSIVALGEHIESRTSIRVSVAVAESDVRLRPEVESEILRIAQEAMNNAVRHSRATQIAVRCDVNPPAAEVSVEDNGRGMQRPRDDSYGLRIMRERAQRIGADLEFLQPPNGVGTRVCLRLSGNRDNHSPHDESMVKR